MTVPEASMNEDYSFESRQDDIRRSGQAFAVQTKSKPHLMKCASNDKLRRGVLGPYFAHQVRACFGGCWTNGLVRQIILPCYANAKSRWFWIRKNCRSVSSFKRLLASERNFNKPGSFLTSPSPALPTVAYCCRCGYDYWSVVYKIDHRPRVCSPDCACVV